LSAGCLLQTKGKSRAAKLIWLGLGTTDNLAAPRICIAKGPYRDGGKTRARPFDLAIHTPPVMANLLDVSLIVTTYQRPANLLRALAAVACQEGVDGRFELIVADDGSTDETPLLVNRFAKTVPFPVRFVTHPHDGFHAARVRNEGAAAAAAPYLVFVDGDCIIPRKHVECHLRFRRSNHVWFGYPMIVDQPTSERFTNDVIRRGNYHHLIPPTEKIRVRMRSWKANVLSRLHHPHKPRLRSTNIGMWRYDFERVNGFDENFRGWGYEDDDFGQRLRYAGCRIRCISHRTPCLHLWHPRDTSAARASQENLRYHGRPNRPIRCTNGLHKQPAVP
jgi:glycosyltransferase involved in cell wall biosynthesis